MIEGAHYEYSLKAHAMDYPTAQYVFHIFAPFKLFSYENLLHEAFI